MPCISQAQQSKDDSAFNANVRVIIKKALIEEQSKKVITHGPIPNKQTAIAIAEPILCEAYGKAQILSEKPYNVKLIDNYWILTGRLPEGYIGGTFFIIISAKDGRVIKLTHYK